MIDLDGVYNPCRPNDRLLLGKRNGFEALLAKSQNAAANFR